MAQVNAGRVRFVGRGEYNNSTQYYTFDFVNYNGNSYFAKSDTLGNLPTDTTHWQLVAEKGNVGSTGPTGNGIASITKTSTSGLVDTYTITFTDGNTTTFNVTNGNGIDHISLTSQSGATKVYTIYFTDGNTTTFTVQDGEVTQEVFDEEIERANMIYNAMPKISDEGTDLTLNNTAECPVYDVELSPSELEQATTTGKNLFNINGDVNTRYNGITGTANTVTGNDLTTTNNGSTNPGYGQRIYVGVGNTINVSAKLKQITYNTTPQSSDRVGTIVIYNDNTTTSRTTLSYYYEDIETTKSITHTASTDYIIVAFNRYTASTSATFTDIQLELGDTATSYEPYTGGIASPNPQYPQEIHTVSGENEIDINSKNVLENVAWNTGAISNDGSVNTSSSWKYCEYVDISKGKWKIWHKNASVNNKTAIYDRDKNFIRSFNIIANNTIDLSEYNGYYLRTSIDSINNLSDKVILYQEQTYPISLGDLEYCKIGDYEDLFFKNVVGSEYYDSTLELNKWYLKKNINKVIFDGSEEWGILNNTPNVFFYDVGTENYDATRDKKVISDKFNGVISTSSATQFNDYANYSIAIRGTSHYIGIKDNSFSTASDFKTWLSTHNTIVYYVLATPTYTLLSNTLQTQLDNIHKAITYQGKTNVSQTNNDLPFVIKLSAIRDLSGIFELIQ